MALKKGKQEIEIRHAVIESPSYGNLVPRIKSQRKSIEIPSNFLYSELKGKFASIVLFDESHPDLLPEISIPRCQKIGISPIVGSNRSNARDIERLAYFISNQPNEILLSKCETQEQLWSWIRYRRDNVLTAACFLTASEDNPQNPLDELLKRELIDRWNYKYTWTTGLLLANLWQLLSSNYELLATIFRHKWDYPFNNCQQLAQEIIGHELNNRLNKELELFHTKEYFEEHPYDLKQICQLRRKKINQHQLSSKENKKYWQLIDRYSFEPNIWSEHLTEICNLLIEMDSKGLFSVAPTLDQLWQIRLKYIKKLDRLMYLKLRTKKAIVHQHWINGKRRNKN